MELIDILKESNIILNLKGKNQNEAINELVDILETNGATTNAEQFKDAIYKRENEISTAVGHGVAIPHAQCQSISEPTIIMGRSLEGIDYGGQNTNLIFMIAAPEEASNEHLNLLSQLSSLLMNEVFRAKLIVATSADEILNAIKKERSKEKKIKNKQSDNDKYINAITACMTGIAHTYITAESLKEAASNKGMRIKVQNNRANGPENKLTANDIKNADAIIVSHDVQVDTSLLKHKPYVDVPVKKAINDAETLINKAISFRPKENATNDVQGADAEVEDSNDKGLNFYKHIMSGVSYMIPFVVVGGIFIAISFMFGIYAADPDSDQYNVFAHFFSQVGGDAAFELMIPILAGFIGFSIADKQGLAPAMIGGMMASIGGSGFLGGMIAGFVGGF